MTSPVGRALLVALLMISAPLALRAQDSEENPADSARFQWGPLHFTPGIAISNVGVDNNVFNSATDPISDTTAAIGPAVNLWSNLGPLRIAEKSSGQYLYFKDTKSQRSWNTINELKLELPLGRLKPFAIGSYNNTRQRPGYEIDSRSRASVNTATLGTSIRISSKTTALLSASRSTTAFDQSETFLGTDLANSLNRHTDTELAQLRYQLTPLTTFVLAGDAAQDRFEFERVRNTDSFSVRPGFEFKPFALIAGSASVGYRHFNVLSDSIQDFQGVVATVDAKYRLTTSTLVSARLNRDLTFSYEDVYPYYTLTDTLLTITQRIRAKWDVTATGGLQSLAYRGLTKAATIVTQPPRTDRGRVAGLGVGHYFGETLRVGVDVNYFSRRSLVEDRQYDGLRAGLSVAYGMK